MGTLGKAFGTFGAFVAGSATLIETLIQKARTYIYTTALPPAVAEATRASLRIVRTESWRRDKLSALTRHFRAGAEQLGLQLMPSSSAIQVLVIGESEKALALSQALLDKRIWVSAIRPPTVPKHTARLRITFSAQHEPSHVDQLLDALAEVVR
jgi:8-amino-7-oxononanoate synthase